MEIEDKYMYTEFKKKMYNKSLNELNKQTRNEEQATPLNCTGFSSFLFISCFISFLFSKYIYIYMKCSQNANEMNKKKILKINNEKYEMYSYCFVALYYAIYKYTEMKLNKIKKKSKAQSNLNAYTWIYEWEQERAKRTSNVQ